MQKHILLLICLISALKAYDLLSIIEFMKNIPIDRTYSGPTPESYIKFDRISSIRAEIEGTLTFDIVFKYKKRDSETEMTSNVNLLVRIYLL
jgi:hypothetical protein